MIQTWMIDQKPWIRAYLDLICPNMGLKFSGFVTFLTYWRLVWSNERTYGRAAVNLKDQPPKLVGPTTYKVSGSKNSVGVLHVIETFNFCQLHICMELFRQSPTKLQQFSTNDEMFNIGVSQFRVMRHYVEGTKLLFINGIVPFL